MTRDAAKSIFLDLLEIPDREQEQYIARACDGDEELSSRVNSLLRAHRSAEMFLGGVDETPARRSGIGGAMPEMIGGFRVIERLGEGGFGSVYLCEQDEPITRRVAIKVLRDHDLSPTAPQRFEEERMLLSRMNHPGIARVLDAGRTASGQAYIVMEHVDGPSITRYSDHHRLGLEGRLRLCVQACRALQHAHQKGVIHRDIKPSNVLVCEIDGEPVVKIIDFGVSKAFVEELKPANTITRSMQLVGTPQYMSPEQASAGTQSLDTRSDVYAMGVLLYELMTGLQPFDAERLRSASATQLERIIREIDPVRPSLRVAQGDEVEISDIAKHRSTGRSQLINALKGEVDWIIMRAMEKVPDRRYPTANMLGDDINRALNREPVEAGPPNGVYRARRFVTRHRVPVMLGSVAVISLILITAMSLINAARLRDANAQISKTLENREQVILFTEDMLAGIDPAEARDRDFGLLREVLDRAATRLETDFSNDAGVESRLRVMVGGLYHSLGDFETARPYLEQAVARSSTVLGELDPQTIVARSSLGSLYAEMSRFNEAREQLEIAVRSAEQTHGPTGHDTMTARNSLAAVYNGLGLSDEAIVAYRSLLEYRVRVLGDLHDDTMATRNNLANALRPTGANEEARELFELVLEHQLGSIGDDHPDTLRTRTNLALLYASLGLNDRALVMNRDILAQKRRVLGDRHPSVLVSMVNLALVLDQDGQLDEARSLLDEALSISLADLGGAHQYTLTIRNNYAGLLRRNGDPEGALPLQRQAYEGCIGAFGENHPLTIQSCGNYIQLMQDLGNWTESLPLAETNLSHALAVFGEQDPRYLPQLKGLLRAQIQLGVIEKAIRNANRLVELSRSVHGEDSEQLADALDLRHSLIPHDVAE